MFDFLGQAKAYGVYFLFSSQYLSDDKRSVKAVDKRHNKQPLAGR